MAEIKEIIKKAGAYQCLECGKCTVNCPVSWYHQGVSPRMLVRNAIFNPEEEVLKDEFLWSCLTCSLCLERCPSDVHLLDFIHELRIKAFARGEGGFCTHGGSLQSLMRMMAKPELKQSRLDWISKDLKIAEKGDILYFTGCLPYFDAYFAPEFELNTLDIARSTIKILNSLGIEPVLMAEERCCGHDLLWAGDIENFRKLAQLNMEVIKKTGAKKIITTCPEGTVSLAHYYPKYAKSLGIPTQHISQFLAENGKELKLKPLNLKVTYQDPCRLGRHLGIYQEPRDLLALIPEIEIQEMPKNRNLSICCGASCWINCSTYSKQIQVNRLKEAKATGADVLITSCPKCQIHFLCAKKDNNLGKELKIKIQDITSLIASAL
jgi:heterodisulfide reductase subunit D